jgi:hypothetical protein
MVSDDEILSAAHRMLGRINRGEASLYLAGEDFARELLTLAANRNQLPAVSYEDEVPRTPPGVIGN